MQRQRRTLLKVLPMALLPLSVHGQARLSQKNLEEFLKASALGLKCPREQLDPDQGLRLLAHLARQPLRWSRYQNWLHRPEAKSTFGRALLAAWYHGIFRDETPETVFPAASGLLFKAYPWAHPPGSCLESTGDWSHPPRDLRISD